VIRLAIACFIAGLVLGGSATPQDRADADAPGRLRFAALGDHGTGKRPQAEVGAQLAMAHAQTPLDLVILLGDNMYGSQKPKDYVTKFERPYAALLQARVPFFAALGNHDDHGQLDYRPFNMNGRRYYTFVRKGVRFVVLDTNLLNQEQLTWAETVLSSAREEWTIAYFHHPLYSDAGRHGSNVELRVALEPLLRNNGVDVVFSGHDHAYQRFKPQHGITYFLAGSSGQLRKGDLRPSSLSAAGYDQDQAFVVADVDGPALTFQTITRTGRVIDAGTIARAP
jgi:predicted phosphodiesterase